MASANPTSAARHPSRSKGGEALRSAARWLLGAGLVFAGISHFRNSQEFLAQVPPWMPAPDAVVAISGVVEIALGLALLLLGSRRVLVGWVAAAFFVLIFPGNISQFLTGTDAFGLDSDLARAVRLLFQPLLVVWALWCTGAWRDWRAGRAQHAGQAAPDTR